MILFFSILRLLVALFLALSFGKMISKIKLPSILGWLISGMILGPYVLNLLNFSLLEASSYQVLLSIIEISVGIMIGAELVFEKLKEYGKKIILTTFIQSFGTFILVTFVFGLIFYFTETPLYASVIFGGIGLATAPAPALSIVDEFNTDGPITRTLIPMAALDDIISFVVFYTAISTIIAQFSTDAMPLYLTLFIRIVLPVLIGMFIGLFAGNVLRKERNHLQTLFIISFFIISASVIGLFFNYWVLSEPILNYMLIGLAFASTFANMVSAERLYSILYAFNPLLRLSLAVLIMNLGAPLDFRLILGSGIFTAVYILTRSVGKYSFAYLGASVTNMHPNVKKYLGFTLLPHSGTSLIFTGIAVTSLLPFDPETALLVQGTISAAAVINEILAVILSKKAFDWADETNTRQ